MHYEWDERKRIANLEKHGLDLAEAWKVFEASKKITFAAPQIESDEVCWMDIAEVQGVVLVLVYTRRADSSGAIRSDAPDERKGGLTLPRSKIVRYTTEELKELERRGQTKTDWKRVKAMRDEDILIDEDSPEITAEMWRNAIVTGRRPPKRNITLRIDPEIIEWFKAKGKGYQTRMNAVLRAYIELHRKGHKKAS